MVPSTTAASFGASFYTDEISQRFLELVYGISWSDFALKYQGFAMSGLQGTYLCYWCGQYVDGMWARVSCRNVPLPALPLCRLHLALSHG